VYTNPENKNAQRHRQTDGQTDGQQDGANSRPYCVAVRSAKRMAKCVKPKHWARLFHDLSKSCSRRTFFY